jgi:phosphatidate cytidylyltransferase
VEIEQQAREAARSGPEPRSGVVHPKPPSPRGPETTRWRPSNLTLRLLTAVLLIPPVIWACYRGGLPFVITVALFNAVAINEFYNFISVKGVTPHRLLGTIAAVLLPFVAWVGDTFYATSLLTAVLLTVMILQLTRARIQEAIASVSVTFFGVFYVGWLLSHCVSVRFIQPDLVRRYGEVAAIDLHPEIGFFFMLLCLCPAVISDTGAYFVGRAYGRRSLARSISPGKTVEGAIGGLAAGTGAAIVVKLVFDHLIPGGLSHGFSMMAAAFFGVAISAVSILGDLIESLLKRDAELKDAGSILPGVGGVLDRIDSALLAVPVTYYLLLAYYYLRLML